MANQPGDYGLDVAIAFIVQVLRRPGRAAITGSSSSIVVGGHAKLTCRADDVGSPQAEYRWASPATGGTYGSLDGSTLTVEHATITDNGEYRCMPHNKIGDGEEGVFILQVSTVLFHCI